MLYLLHGALGSASQIAPMAATLSASAPRVIELAGHGVTPLGDRPFSIEGFVAQIVQQMDADDVECADFFGYSMGGYIALALALSHPERVSRVATLGTKFEWTPEVAAHESSRLDPQKMRAKVPTFADQLTARHADAGGWESMLAHTSTLLTDLGANPPLGDAELGRIAHRVCVMVGDRDVTVTVEESARIARALPCGSLAVLPLTNHPIEQVDQAMLATLIARAL